jgi:hypothetical protein
VRNLAAGVEIDEEKAKKEGEEILLFEERKKGQQIRYSKKPNPGD